MIQAKTLGKYIEKSQEIAAEVGADPEIARKVLEAVEKRINRYRRHPREPVPEGGISIREAARKYDIIPSTLSRWCNNGKVNILKRTLNWVYLEEKSLLEYLKENNNHTQKGRKSNITAPI